MRFATAFAALVAVASTAALAAPLSDSSARNVQRRHGSAEALVAREEAEWTELAKRMNQRPLAAAPPKAPVAQEVKPAIQPVDMPRGPKGYIGRTPVQLGQQPGGGGEQPAGEKPLPALGERLAQRPEGIKLAQTHPPGLGPPATYDDAVKGRT
ncbi:hypothetical protein EIP91_009333 [Steccherinum ochraceum]|uniref:Uncharacterized protein n=1 Tax=Steccherinum ochraceum TaxID=92696 RepID=A0A4R0RP78_9APHY|nr:hypothetical protein EIP91_009333 [Steccherinum ochraceum]